VARRFELTPAVTLALDRAKQWAARFAAVEVEPVHLLLGLLQEDEGQPAVLLARAGTDVAQLRQTLAAPAAPAAEDTNSHLSLHETTQEVLRRAGELSHLSSEGTLASDQVLLTLLRQAPELRAALQGLGLDFARLEQEIEPTLGPALPLDEPLNLQEPAESIDTARILDAAANRAREAVRVLEDYCRFVLDDAFLSGELKRLRHDLADALSALPAHWLLEGRDSLGDVGTVLSTPAEEERHSLAAVAQANSKRLQEALRSLEEFGKLHSPSLGRAVKALRYRSYTLEQALVLGSTARTRLADARLYVLVTDASCRASLSGTIHEAAAGGAQIIQLREKNLDDRALLERARQVRQWTRKLGVLFIMNDRPDIALLAQADGVHLGQEDLPVRDARRILGPDTLIGVSTHNLDQVRRAVLAGASYLGIGPTFPSGTKIFPDFPGLEFIRQATAETSLPAFVLGGITVENVAEVVAAGGRRIAVSQTICQAEDPRQTAAALRRILS
jgi:thiamine-phosphate pyrophosphorylase